MAMDFRTLGQEICNGCDLITGEENKLSTEEVAALGEVTLDDFSVCTLDGKNVGVVTLKEAEGKYYWGGQALSNMVNAFIEACGSEAEARSQYADEKKKNPVRMRFEMTKTKSKQDFVKVTVL